eukprot:7104745-Alexandrium_andersonii.AAC.1
MAAGKDSIQNPRPKVAIPLQRPPDKAGSLRAPSASSNPVTHGAIVNADAYGLLSTHGDQGSNSFSTSGGRPVGAK